MRRCRHPGCGWQAIAPSDAVAREQYLEHLVREHAREVDASVPDGMVEVKADGDDEWELLTVEEAKERHGHSQ